MTRRKRIFDIVVGSLLALVALPVIAVLALVVASRFRASPFFVQYRIGLGGRQFRMLKLRTLRPETDPYVLKDDLPAAQAPRRAAAAAAGAVRKAQPGGTPAEDARCLRAGRS